MAGSGEADLFKIFGVIWRRRALIAGMGAVFAVCGIAIAYIIPPVYEVSTKLRPVEINQLDALNRSKVISLSPAEALKRVGARLDSYNTRLGFFSARPELVKNYQNKDQTFEQAFQDFNVNSLSVLQSDSRKVELLSEFIGLSMRYGTSVDGAAVLNEFVDYAVEQERVQISKDMQVIVSNRLGEVDANLKAALDEYRASNQGQIAKLEESDSVKRAKLEDELKALRVQLKMQRESRLAELDESINIARSLGLKKPSTPSLMADEVATGGTVMRTEVNGRAVPLYFMGTDVLEAERTALRKRASDDFVEPRVGEIRKELLLLSHNRNIEAIKSRVNDQNFLEGVEALRAEKLRLLSLDTQLNGMQLVNIDQRAVPAGVPIKPRKVLIVLIMFAAGLLIGVATALVRAAYKNNLREMRTLQVNTTFASIPSDDLPPVQRTLLKEV